MGYFLLKELSFLLLFVAPQGQDREVAKTLAMIIKSNKEIAEHHIHEDYFVNATVQNL